MEKACLGNSGRRLYGKVCGGVLQAKDGGGLACFRFKRDLIQSKQLTLPGANIACENRPSQKERIIFQSLILECDMSISGRVPLFQKNPFN